MPLGRWPGKWLVPAAASGTWAFRLRLDLSEPLSDRLWVSADRRYRLMIDGKPLADGPEPGLPSGWRADPVMLNLSAGTHTILAIVEHNGWNELSNSPGAAPGFLCVGEGSAQPLLGTGVAAWEMADLPGREVAPCTKIAFHSFTVVGQLVDGAQVNWEREVGAGDGWKPATAGPEADTEATIDRHSCRALVSARLPVQERSRLTGMRVVHLDGAAAAGQDAATPACHAVDHFADEARSWQAWLDGTAAVEVPAGTVRRVIIDLGAYACFQAAVVAAGEGGSLRLHTAEALYLELPTGWSKGVKGRRDEVAGRTFIGMGPLFRTVAAEHRYDAGSWLAGRFIEICVTATSGRLRLAACALTATGFPLARRDRIASDQADLPAAEAVMWRTLRMCAHGTTMDCPYYERLQYAGDTRLQNLVAMACGGESRLAGAAIESFARSRAGGALPLSRSPTRVAQSIPPFAWWWVAMLHDIAWWSGDGLAEAKRWLPDARATADMLLNGIGPDGLIVLPPGWGFTDWAVGWHMGMVPGLHRKPNAVAQFQAAYVVGLLAELEDAVGEPALAGRWRARAAALVAAGSRFRRGVLFADGLEGDSCSEHANALAVLAGAVPPAEQPAFADALLTTPGLHRATVYFTHYLFDALGRLGRPAAIQKRLRFWLDLPGQGFTTTPEEPEPSRSDCHAWGAHPLWHLHATFAGVRPTAPGFASVRIQPQLGDWKHLECDLPVPQGVIRSRWQVVGGRLSGSVELPAGVSGVLVLADREQALKTGVNVY